MVHAFSVELLWLFARLVERHGFPRFSHRYRLAKPSMFLKRLFGAYLSHLAPIPHLIHVLLCRTSR